MSMEMRKTKGVRALCGAKWRVLGEESMGLRASTEANGVEGAIERGGGELKCQWDRWR